MSTVKKIKYFVKGMNERPKYLYTKEEQQLFEKYVNDKLGKFKHVYRELYSPDIHLDILIIPPTEKENYYKLVTRGMGAYKMNVPDIIKNQGLDRAELVMYLPPNWDFNFKKEENYWVIRQMKLIARAAIEENSWVGFGHSFSNDENATIPFADNTKFTSTILLNSLDNNFEYLNLDLGQKGKINFYQVIPIYKEELEYKQSHNIQDLMKQFSPEDLFPVVNINRKNYCDKEINKNQIELDEEIEK